MNLKGEKGRDLTKSCDKNPYTHRTKRIVPSFCSRLCHNTTDLPTITFRVRQLIGAVCRNHCIKRVVPFRCLDGHVKEPYEMSMALGARP